MSQDFNSNMTIPVEIVAEDCAPTGQRTYGHSVTLTVIYFDISRMAMVSVSSTVDGALSGTNSDPSRIRWITIYWSKHKQIAATIRVSEFEEFINHWVTNGFHNSQTTKTGLCPAFDISDLADR